jgi:WD40 repeat protein
MVARHWLVAFMLLLCRMAAAMPRSITRPATPANTRLQPYLALGHTTRITTAAWSPDGRTLATACFDQAVILWNRATWRPRAHLSGHTAPILTLAWSPDGKLLAIADQSRTTILWDTASGQRRAALHADTAFYLGLAWSPDGKTLAGAGADHLLLWDPVTGRLRASLGKGDMFLAWSPDGKTLASGGARSDAAATLWDAHTGRRRAVFAMAEGPFTAGLAWSPDGRRLVTTESEGLTTIWDVASGRSRVLQRGSTGSGHGVNPLAWSPDGRFLATGKNYQNDVVIVWDTATWRQQASFQGPFDPFEALAWSPDGQVLAAHSSSDLVLWDAHAGKRRPAMEHVSGPVAWSPDSKLFTCSDPHYPLALRDGHTGKRVAVLASRVTPVSHLAWNPNGREIAAGSEEPFPLPHISNASRAFVRIWDISSGRPRTTLSELSDATPRNPRPFLLDRIYDLTWSPDGSTVATTTGQYGYIASGIDGPGMPPQAWHRCSAMLWDAATGARRATLKLARARTVWSPDGKLLATGYPGAGEAAALWDAATGELRAVLDTKSPAWRMAWSPDGKALATPGYLGQDFAYLLWDVASGKLRASLIGPRASYSYSDLAWSPDGTRLAIVYDDQEVQLWETATGTLRTTLTLRTAPRPEGFARPLSQMAVLAWSPDEKLLATGSPGHGLVKLWNPENGQLQVLLSGPAEGTSHLQWSPDGRTLACAYRNHTVRLWNLAIRRPRATLHGHTDSITALAWGPTGRTIATTATDGSIRLWNTPTGRERAAFYSLDEGKEWLAITPDGYFAASPHGADVLWWRQGTKLWPLEKFRRRFERPDLVRQRLLE